MPSPRYLCHMKNARRIGGLGVLWMTPRRPKNARAVPRSLHRSYAALRFTPSAWSICQGHATRDARPLRRTSAGAGRGGARKEPAPVTPGGRVGVCRLGAEGTRVARVCPGVRGRYRVRVARGRRPCPAQRRLSPPASSTNRSNQARPWPPRSSSRGARGARRRGGCLPRRGLRTWRASAGCW